MVKAGQRFAAEYGLMLVVPDTSPRTGIEGEDDDWDSWHAYVDATVEPGDRTTRCTAMLSTSYLL